jgi:hypothetical protein
MSCQFLVSGRSSAHGCAGWHLLFFVLGCMMCPAVLKTYGPGGSNPLLPGAQDNSKVTVAFGPLQLSGISKPQAFISLVLRNPDSQAVDVSGWKMTKTSDGFSFVLPKGECDAERSSSLACLTDVLGQSIDHGPCLEQIGTLYAGGGC